MSTGNCISKLVITIHQDIRFISEDQKTVKIRYSNTQRGRGHTKKLRCGSDGVVLAVSSEKETPLLSDEDRKTVVPNTK